jgi:hypothetical protein
MKSAFALNFIGFVFYLFVAKICKYSIIYGTLQILLLIVHVGANIIYNCYLRYLSVLALHILLLTVHVGTNFIYDCYLRNMSVLALHI